jgi:ABC-2 type transport system permease protein
MTTLLSTEALKLRTVRSPLLLLAAAQLIVIAGVSGLVISGADLQDSDTTTKAIAHVGLAALCSLVLGILAVAGEYRHRTITDTYLSTPQRDRTLLAKLAVYTGVGLGLGAVTSVTALIAAKVWWAAKGTSFDLADADVWRTVAGCIVWNGAFAALGVAVGAFVRNLTAAIAVALAWIALVEGIVGQLVGSGLSRWLPFAAAQALGRATVGNAGHLPQWGAAGVLLGYVVVLAVLAASNTLRRDVS